MRRCIFCGHEIDIVLWVVQDMTSYPVPACRRCAEDRRLSAFGARPGGDAETTNAVSCRCCGRGLPSDDSWPPLVWVHDGRSVMAVCNACRVEYALEAVSAPAPLHEQGRRDEQGRLHDVESPPLDEPEAADPE